MVKAKIISHRFSHSFVTRLGGCEYTVVIDYREAARRKHHYRIAVSDKSGNLLNSRETTVDGFWNGDDIKCVVENDTAIAHLAIAVQRKAAGKAGGKK